MPRSSIAVLAAVFLTGSLIAPAASAQSGPPGANGSGRHHQGGAERGQRPPRDAGLPPVEQPQVDSAAVEKARANSALLDKRRRRRQ